MTLTPHRNLSVAAVLLMLSASRCVSAADCEAFLNSSVLPQDPYPSSVYVTMVTLNNLNTASYTESRLYYLTRRDRPAKAREIRDFESRRSRY